MTPFLAALFLSVRPAFSAQPLDIQQEGAHLYQAGKLTQAAEAFEEAIGNSGTDPAAYLNAGIVYRDLGHTRRSYEMFQKAAALLPGDADVQAAFGWAALRDGHPGQAETAFKTSLSIDPDNPQALLGEGRVLMDSGGPAVETFQKLVAARPDFSLGWTYLARAYEEDGELESAVQAYQKAVEVDPTFSEVRRDLGSLYQELKDFHQAFKQFQKILTVDPRDQAARLSKKLLARKLAGLPKETEEYVAISTSSTPLVRSPGREGMPTLRIGIGTSPGGRPVRKKALVFRSTGEFVVVDPKTGKRLANGPGGERFVVRRDKYGWFEVDDQRRVKLLRFRDAISVRPEDPDHDSLVFQEVRTAQGYAWSEVGDRQFKGSMEIHVRGRGLYMVNVLPVEDYLYGVLTQEMPSRFPPEALKAQAIIARTHALFVSRYLKPHHRFGYDLCDGQHCQVYGGVIGESAQARQAAEGTRGLVLRFQGNLAQTPYSSNCGGETQSSGEIPGWAKLPYLQGVMDGEAPLRGPRTPWQLEMWLKKKPVVYCSLVPGMPPARFRWTRVVSAKQMQAHANRLGRIGTLKRLLVVRRSLSGHANEVWLEGALGHVRIRREEDIRRLLGLGALRSTLFIVETERNERGDPLEFVFYGGGWGHGVGLCQYGAAGRAIRGQNYLEILQHYYPGTSVEGPY